MVPGVACVRMNGPSRVEAGQFSPASAAPLLSENTLIQDQLASNRGSLPSPQGGVVSVPAHAVQPQLAKSIRLAAKKALARSRPASAVAKASLWR